MSYVVLDFETHDPWISQGRGSGWPEGYADFVCAVTQGDGNKIRRWDDIEELMDYLSEFDTIVAHNAMYEMGILHEHGFNIFGVGSPNFVCTRILAVLYNNNLLNFGLDSLAKIYVGESKNADETIGKIAIEMGLVKSFIINPGKKATAKHIKEIFDHDPQAVFDYCENDVTVTHKLYKHLIQNDFKFDVKFYSDLQKALIVARSKGILVDNKKRMSLEGQIDQSLSLLERQLSQYPIENFSSPKQLAAYFSSQGLKLPLTKPKSGKEGQPSTGIEALESLDHPLAELILEHRGLTKLKTTYMNPLTELEPVGNFKVYPEVKIFGAPKTGRSSSVNPNIQQIPTRKAMGNEVRSLYIPEPGYKMASLDYSGQELRLIINLAYEMKFLDGESEIITNFSENPDYDFYGAVAKKLDLNRNATKTVVLGICYGQWAGSLSSQLDISMEEATKIINMLNKELPFLSRLFKTAKATVGIRGYVKTLTGRKIYIDKDFARNGLNAAIQGSAADQTNTAIVNAYRKGLYIIAPIHDEILMQYKDDQEVQDMKIIMEEAMDLVIPTVVHIKTGLNWGVLS